MSEEVWRRRYERAKARAEQAELLVEERTRELYRSNLALQALTEELEARVADRTERLRVARDEAVEANRTRGAFLAGMSHEIRTPLSVIVGYSELLREEADDDLRDDTVQTLDRVLMAAGHLLTLVNDVLDLAKVDAGALTMQVEATDIVAVVREVISLLEPRAQRNGNRLSLVVADGLPLAQADSLRLKQCVLNLGTNAVKFTHDGQVELSVYGEPGRVAVGVRDTGRGLTKPQMEKLFQPYVQADRSTVREFGGTGLGLTLTRRMVELMGGTVTVESAGLGHGATFTLWVPTVSSRQVRRTPEAAH